MVNIINPRVRVVSFGPSLKIDNALTPMEITPDEFVYGASRITYKDMFAIDELFKAKADEKDITDKMKGALIKSAGSGHASMATTPGMWVIFEGDTSKFVDSIFTTAKFGSSLMPSGRRVPITKDNILVPRAIAEAGEDAIGIYMKVSNQNIDAYETLQQRGVPKEEAAKIVQYGHKGGGFAFMPLETLISFSREIEHDNNCIPEEGKEIVRQLEDFVKSNGMKTIYEARKAAPRTGCPNPSIFHDRKNLAHDFVSPVHADLLFPNVRDSRVLDVFQIEGLKEAIKNYVSVRNEVFGTKSVFGWKSLLREIENISADYNDAVNIMTCTNTPWRVWGEVKRHRTLDQTAESVYHAAARATELLKFNNLRDATSVPDSFDYKTEDDNFKLWKKCFSDSIAGYNELVSMGIKKSEAIAIIPRGLKLGVIKSYNLYNLTTGYMSLRLCNTAEREMRHITDLERDAILRNGERALLSPLLVPKCGYVGFCPEEKFCKNIVEIRPNYNQEMHEASKKERENDIRARL